LKISLTEPYKNVDPVGTSNKPDEDQVMQTDEESNTSVKNDQVSGTTGASSGIHQQKSPPKSLKDAVKPKNKRRKNADRGTR
jgi:hypothetical protein